MHKYWLVENLAGGFTSRCKSFNEATTVARTRAHLAPQDSFAVLEALLLFSAERGREDIVGRSLLSEAQVRSSDVSKV